MKTTLGHFQRSTHSRRQRGAVSIDLAIGLGIIAMLIAALTATGFQHRKTAKAMEAQREAARHLEQQAGVLRAGKTINKGSITSERIDENWVKLRETSGGDSAELWVFVPDQQTHHHPGEQP